MQLISKCLVFLLAASFEYGLISVSIAQQISIANHSFEDRVLSDGHWSDNDIPGWQISGNLAGTQNWTDAQFYGATDNDGTASTVPHGLNSAYLRVPSASISQTLENRLRANTDYSLSYHIGHRADGGFAGYRAELLAGETVLAFDDNAVNPDGGQWKKVTFDFFSGNLPSNLGENLSIRFTSESINDPPGSSGFYQTTVDNVSLMSQARAPMGGDRLDGQIALDSSKGKLVFLTHGWANDNPEPGAWLDTMAASIGSRASEDWDIVPFKWEDAASTGVNSQTAANAALAAATNLGIMHGQKIAAGNYDEIHLIGHSAGGAFIDQVSRVVDRLSPQTKVHLTFLDAYLPQESFVHHFGEKGDFVDHYFTTDLAPNTQNPIFNAHNVDISALDFFDDHSFPREWYQQTWDVTDRPSSWLNYGARLSSEFGEIENWDPSLMQNGFPHKRVVLLPDGSWDELVGDEPSLFGVSLDDLQTSDTGTFQFETDTLTMTTGSPVWFSTLVEADGSLEFLQFDALFGETGEGYLTVLLNNEIILGIDQRYVLEQDFATYWVPVNGLIGIQTLAFRLDDYSDLGSSISLREIEFGISAIPEPSSGGLILGIAITWLISMRKRNSNLTPQVCAIKN